jgi:hypothetical protein
VPLDFNHFGVWLHALFGAAVVTGAADPFTHVFSSGLEALPWRSHEWKLAGNMFEDVGLVGSRLSIDMSRAAGFQRATVELMGQTQNKVAASGGGTPAASWPREECAAAIGVFKLATPRAAPSFLQGSCMRLVQLRRPAKPCASKPHLRARPVVTQESWATRRT